jgi:hypothetical protein
MFAQWYVPGFKYLNYFFDMCQINLQPWAKGNVAESRNSAIVSIVCKSAEKRTRMSVFHVGKYTPSPGGGWIRGKRKITSKYGLWGDNVGIAPEKGNI